MLIDNIDHVIRACEAVARIKELEEQLMPITYAARGEVERLLTVAVLAKAVVDSWEDGDLAARVRDLDTALKSLEGL